MESTELLEFIKIKYTINFYTQNKKFIFATYDTNII